MVLALDWCFNQAGYFHINQAAGDMGCLGSGFFHQVEYVILIQYGAQLVKPVMEEKKNAWEIFRLWDLHRNMYLETCIQKDGKNIACMYACMHARTLKTWIDRYARKKIICC